MMRLLRTRAKLDYVSVDLDSPLAEHHMDLTRLEFASDQFDLVICSHVLEHIPDDRSALRELKRVLRPGGMVILQQPIRAVDETFEDPAITAPAERERHFGQHDHVRIYGRDFAERLREASFEVTLVRVDELADANDVERYGLRESTAPWVASSDLYVCT